MKFYSKTLLGLILLCTNAACSAPNSNKPEHRQVDPDPAPTDPTFVNEADTSTAPEIPVEFHADDIDETCGLNCGGEGNTDLKLLPMTERTKETRNKENVERAKTHSLIKAVAAALMKSLTWEMEFEKGRALRFQVEMPSLPSEGATRFPLPHLTEVVAASGQEVVMLDGTSKPMRYLSIRIIPQCASAGRCPDARFEFVAENKFEMDQILSEIAGQ